MIWGQIVQNFTTAHNLSLLLAALLTIKTWFNSLPFIWIYDLTPAENKCYSILWQLKEFPKLIWNSVDCINTSNLLNPTTALTIWILEGLSHWGVDLSWVLYLDGWWSVLRLATLDLSRDFGSNCRWGGVIKDLVSSTLTLILEFEIQLLPPHRCS